MGAVLSINYDKTIPVTESGCLIWLGASTPSGYGKVGNNQGDFAYVHRLAYEEAYGQIPDGMQVCHKCDTPSCLEPTHLFAGTPGDNMRDCVSKGRHNSGRRLSRDDVFSIKAMSGVPCRDIAVIFGISEKYAIAVRSGYAESSRAKIKVVKHG